MSEEAAFKALVDLSNLVRAHAQALPAQVDASPRWSGIGFTLMGTRFIAPLGQIAEMLEVPAFSRLPGVQNWALGVANVRGRLLPLIDLPAFLGGKLSGPKKQHRVLVVDVSPFFCGLIVDQAHGMQHFTAEDFRERAEAVPTNIEPLVRGAYRDATESQWAVLHIPALLEDPRFANAAVG